MEPAPQPPKPTKPAEPPKVEQTRRDDGKFQTMGNWMRGGGKHGSAKL